MTCRCACNGCELPPLNRCNICGEKKIPFTVCCDAITNDVETVDD